MSLTETRFSSVRAPFPSPLRENLRIYIYMYIYTATLATRIHACCIFLYLSLFFSIFLSLFLFFFPPIRSMACVDAKRRAGGGEKRRERSSALVESFETSSHDFVPSRKRAPFHPPPLLLFFRTRLITLDKRTRSVITFFLYRPPFLNDPRWKFKLTFLFIFSFFVFTY